VERNPVLYRRRSLRYSASTWAGKSALTNYVGAQRRIAHAKKYRAVFTPPRPMSAFTPVYDLVHTQLTLDSLASHTGLSHRRQTNLDARPLAGNLFQNRVLSIPTSTLRHHG